jgi:hypothetical protein
MPEVADIRAPGQTIHPGCRGGKESTLFLSFTIVRILMEENNEKI